ncbi:MAG: hypothetical protein WC890_08275 [Candidatus Margulisiibacteriota bacterium]
MPSTQIALPVSESGRKFPQYQDAAGSAVSKCASEGISTCSQTDADALNQLQALYLTMKTRANLLLGKLGNGTASDDFMRAYNQIINESCTANPLKAAQYLAVFELALSYIKTDYTDRSVGPNSPAARLIQAEIDWLQKPTSRNKPALILEQELKNQLDAHGKALLDEKIALAVETACQYQRFDVPSISSVNFSTGDLRADTNNVAVVIVGAYFPEDTGDTKVAFLDKNNVPDPKITINGSITSSRGQILLNISVAAEAESGPRTIRVYSEKYDTNFKDYSATIQIDLLSMERFSVNNDAVPTVYQGQTGVVLTIAGKRFDKVETLSVNFFNGSLTDIPIASRTANQITTGPITIPQDTPPGQYHLQFYGVASEQLTGHYLINVRPKQVVDSYRPAAWREKISPAFVLTSGVSNHDKRLPDTAQSITDQTPTLGFDLGLDARLIGSENPLLWDTSALRLQASLNGGWDWFAHINEADTNRWNAGGAIDFSAPVVPYVEPGLVLGFQHLNMDEASPLGAYPYFNGSASQLIINPSLKRSWLGEILTTRLYAKNTGDWLSYATESSQPDFHGKNNTWRLGVATRLSYASSTKSLAPVIDLDLFGITGREQVSQIINGQSLTPIDDPKRGWGSEIKATLPNLALTPHLAAEYSRYTLGSNSEVPLYNFEFNAGLRNPRVGEFDFGVSTQRLEPTDSSRWTRFDTRYTLPRQAQFMSFGAGVDSFSSQNPNSDILATTLTPFVDVRFDFMRLPFGFLGTPVKTK